MKEILVIAEYDRKDITDLTKEVLGVGKKLAQETGALLSAVVLGNEYDHLGEVLSSFGASVVYLGKYKELNRYNSEIYVGTLEHLIKQKQPELVLCGMTVNGRDLGTRLAARIKTVFIAGCAYVSLNGNGEIEVIRFKLEGKGQDLVTLRNSTTTILGITPEIRGINETTNPHPDFKTELIDVILPEKAVLKHVNTYVSDPGEIDLSEADVVIAGGNGLGSQEIFNLLQEAGALIGASVGGSRVALDKGWISHDRMIGATGKVIRAKVYLALGISGAVQHMMGIKDCQTVIAINKNSRAEMMQAADLAIVGDVRELLPALVLQLRDYVRMGNGDQRP
ncbi:MAG: electron transfer flavoprotein subunit alpha/FixB family protein [Dehalobacterium sp.]